MRPENLLKSKQHIDSRLETLTITDAFNGSLTSRHVGPK